MFSETILDSQKHQVFTFHIHLITSSENQTLCVLSHLSKMFYSSTAWQTLEALKRTRHCYHEVLMWKTILSWHKLWRNVKFWNDLLKNLTFLIHILFVFVIQTTDIMTQTKWNWLFKESIKFGCMFSSHVYGQLSRGRVDLMLIVKAMENITPGMNIRLHSTFMAQTWRRDRSESLERKCVWGRVID